MELFTAPFRAFCACRELPNHYQYTWGGDGTENRATKAFNEPLYNCYTGLGVKYTMCPGAPFGVSSSVRDESGRS
jgi:hypothetical protein